MTKLYFLSWVMLIFSATAGAQGTAPTEQRSYWSFEVKGGYLLPALDDWERLYGTDRSGSLALAAAFKLLPWFELGLSSSYISDTGQGVRANGNLGGKVVYETVPLGAYALLRLRFTQGQWLVPYVGGGFSRTQYRVTVKNQDKRRGSVNGVLYRAGLQFLLDNLDKQAISSLSGYGVEHVYFVLEAQEREAKQDITGLDLGGTSYLAGLLFEF